MWGHFESAEIDPDGEGSSHMEVCFGAQALVGGCTWFFFFFLGGET